MAGQARLTQRQAASPSPRTAGEPHDGQTWGKSYGSASGERLSSTTRTTSGMTSPARRTTTVSPGRRSLALISSSLCSVARETVTPARLTGSRMATGVSTPVRPTWTSMRDSTVSASWAGNLSATAKRGARSVKPKASCKARLSTFTTTPSISKGNSWRCRPMASK